MKNSKITEGLEFEDLRGLIDSEISVDQYKPKVGEEADTVVVAFFVTYEEPAKDLSNFIETSNVEHLDVEVSTSPDESGRYMVFVEFSRDYKLFDKLESLLHDINQITSKDRNEWEMVPIRNKGKSVVFSRESFEKHVVTSAPKYKMMMREWADPEFARLKQLAGR